MDPVPEPLAVLNAPETSPFQRLDPRVRACWRTRLWIEWAILCLLGGGTGAFFLLTNDHSWMLALTAVLGPLLVVPSAFALTLPRVLYRAWSWYADDQELRVRSGVLWHADVLVPHSRIQYVEVRRGLLERRYGLASVVVHTAAAEASQVTVPGLDDAAAEALRTHLISLIDDDRL